MLDEPEGSRRPRGVRTIAEVAALLGGRRLVVLAGAGVSRASGLPIVLDLTDAILARLGCLCSEREALRAAQVPFELFIETLTIFSDVIPLYEIYAGGRPGTFHQLCGKMAQSGRLAAILTTNFDDLFERALSDVGIELDVVFLEEQFFSWRPGDTGIPVLKVHGSIVDVDSLGITIRRVAGQRGVAARDALLRTGLQETGADAFLVAGYSGSDKFDLTPILRRLGASAPELALIWHTTGLAGAAHLTPVADHASAGPFSNFRGWVIECDTDELVAALGDGHGFVAAAEPADFTEKVDAWAERAIAAHGEGVRAYAVGALLVAAARPREALDALRRAEPEITSRELLVRCLIAQARALRDVGQLSEAKSKARQALRFLTEEEPPRLRCVAWLELGILAADDGRHAAALRYYRNAERRGREIDALDIVGIALGNAAIVRKALGGRRRHRRALNDYQEALIIAQSTGDKRSEGRTFGNIGVLQAVNGARSEAIANYRKAREIAVELGDRYHEAIWLANEGEELFAAEPDLARDQVLQAKAMFLSLGSDTRAAECDDFLRRFGRQDPDHGLPPEEAGRDSVSRR